MGQTKKSPSVAKAAKTKKTKTKEVEAVVEQKPAGTLEPVSYEIIALSRRDIISRLSEKLSHFDATIILDAAIGAAGLNIKHEGQLNKEEARQICLALIKRGGPAYAVGAGLYREMIG